MQHDIRTIRDEISMEEFGAKALQILDMISYFAPQIIDADTFLINTKDSKDELLAAVDLLLRYDLIQSLGTRTLFTIKEAVQNVNRNILRLQELENEVLQWTAYFLANVKDARYSDSVRSVRKYLTVGRRLDDLQEIVYILQSGDSRSSTPDSPLEAISSLFQLEPPSEVPNVSLKQIPGQEIKKLDEIYNPLMEDNELEGIQQLFHYHQKFVNNERGCCRTFNLTSEDAPQECSEYSNGVDPDTLRTNRNNAMLLYEQCQYDEAAKILEDVSLKFAHLLGKCHSETLETLMNLAYVLPDLGRCERAEEICIDVCRKYRLTFGEQSIESLSTKHLLGDILFKQGKLQEAADCLKDAFEGFRDVLGPNSSMTTTVKSTCALVHTASRKEVRSIHWLAEEGDLNGVISSIENGTDVNEKDYKGRTPLHYAALNGHVKVAEYLLHQGGMYNDEDYGGETPLHGASNGEIRRMLHLVKYMFKDVKKGNNAIVDQRLTENIQFLKAQDKNGYSVLHWAVHNSHVIIVKQLLNAGADVSTVSLKGNTPLHIACSKGDTEIAEVLLRSVSGDKFGGLINSRTKVDSNTVLHIAVERSDLCMIELLLKLCQTQSSKVFGDLINVRRSTDGSTALHVAVENGDILVVKYLLTALNTRVDLYGDVINARRSTDGSTALHIASENGDLFMVKNLLMFTIVARVDMYGDVINARRSVDGSTGLHIAVINNDNEMLKFLLRPSFGKKFEKFSIYL